MEYIYFINKVIVICICAFGVCILLRGGFLDISFFSFSFCSFGSVCILGLVLVWVGVVGKVGDFGDGGFGKFSFVCG